ncbi:MAG: hypothetical protein WA869_02575, partial [Alloacidobacterium sp.]
DHPCPSRRSSAIGRQDPGDHPKRPANSAQESAKEMTDTQIEEAQKLARDWKPTTKPASLLLQ